MRKRRNDFAERRVEQLLGRLFRRSPRLSEQALRTIARSAVAEPRLPAAALGRSRWAFSRRFTGAAVGLALVAGSGLGFGLGNSLTPKGTAAQGPVGLGFLPERGWNVLQSGTPATPARPAYAIAANVPIDPEDIVAGGLPDPSGLPYATLLKLRPHDIVIVATFTKQLPPEQYGPFRFPPARLPLQIGDVTPYPERGTLIRVEEPLGQYQLRAGVNGYDVDLNIYFGAPEPGATLVDAAQRQLDRLVVRTPRPLHVVRSSEPAAGGAKPTLSVLDRTLVCSTAVTGGARDFEMKGHKGTGRANSTWDRPAFVALTTGPSASGGLNPTILDNSLAWVTAGRPSPTSTFVEESILSSFYRIRTWGTLALSGRRCRPTRAHVALGATGLRGGVLGPFEEGFTCASPRRVVLRVRAVLERPAGLRRHRAFLRSTVPVVEGQLAVRTESGRPLAYAEVFESGKARLFTAPGCFPS